MRLITYQHNGSAAIGVRRDDHLIPVADIDLSLPSSIRQLLAEDKLTSLASKLSQYHGTGISLDNIEYLPLLPDPSKIICIGRNYAAHAKEGGAEVPSYPEVFFRGPSSLVAHNSPIIAPECSDKLDFEGEVAFVIGKKCRHATEENALKYIAGYSLFNDATVRDYQKISTQWTVGKNFDSTGAFGPELITQDELLKGMSSLEITTKLNGKVMQNASIDDLIFPIPKLIAILSQCMTLEPGDVVVTGTPAGVGFARTPPVWMKDGDLIEVSVEGLGTLSNKVQDEG